MSKAKKPYPINLITVDPGVNTFVALWDKTGLYGTFCIKENNKDKHYNADTRIILMAENLKYRLMEIIGDTSKMHIIIQNKEPLQIAMAFFQSKLIGAYLMTFRDLYCKGIKVILKTDWADRFTNDFLNSKINEHFPSFCKTDRRVTDVVALGLAAYGILDKKVNLIKEWI